MAAVAAAAVLMVAGGAEADDLAAARAERAALQQRLDAAAGRLAALDAEAAEIADERDALARELSALAAEVSAAEERLADRVRLVYKHGGMDPVLALIGSAGPGEASQRVAVVASMVRADRAVSETAEAMRTRSATVAERLSSRQRLLAEALKNQRRVAGELQAAFREAAHVEARLEREAERRRERVEAERRRREARRAAALRTRYARPSPGRVVPRGSYACPVAPPRAFSDTWGAPRSGGRRHKGTDILAPRGAHVLAVTGGVVDVRGYGSTAGYWLILRGRDGTNYYYMHLDRFAVADGTRVATGQLIAYNGDTGNARGTPHVHFERHPGGGAAVNPYPLLRRIC